MNSKNLLSSSNTALTDNANLLITDDTVIKEADNSQMTLQETENIKQLARIIKNCDIEAIDDLSALLIDISSSITDNNCSGLISDQDDFNTFSLLDKLKTSDLVKINQGISGWKNNTGILAPSYKPTTEQVNAIYQLIHNNKAIPKKVFNSLIKNKAFASNFQNLIINGKIQMYTSESYKLLTENFLSDLKQGMFTLDKTFDKIGLSKYEKTILHTFVSKTASILFNLGFADSINHSVQVARKCVIEAYRKKLSKPEILQSAIVGWIHDPKLPGNYSWSNLSTHPIIASAISLDILTQPDMHKLIADYLKKLKFVGKNIKNVEYFVKGVVEAVAINNDSKFVLDNAIFTRPSWAPGIPESGGVIDQLSSLSVQDLSKLGLKFDSQDLIRDITEIAIDRFYAPANMRKPASFNGDILRVLKYIQIETGLIGIKVDTLKKIFIELSDRYEFVTSQPLLTTFQQLLGGEIKDEEFISDLSSSIQDKHKNDNNVFVRIKVSADKLFSHHDEMKYAPDAALMLAIADRLLLSPHKILEAGVQNSVLGRLISFMDSFKDNVKTLPKSAQPGGRVFQRDLYVSIIKTADELTGQSNYSKFIASLIGLPEKYSPDKTIASKDINSRIIDNQIEYLEYLIRDVDNWKNADKGVGYGDINPKDADTKKEFNRVLEVLTKNYDFTIDHSSEMFGYIKINTFQFIDRLFSKF